MLGSRQPPIRPGEMGIPGSRRTAGGDDIVSAGSFRGSSVAERAPVKRLVGSSNLPPGATPRGRAAHDTRPHGMRPADTSGPAPHLLARSAVPASLAVTVAPRACGEEAGKPREKLWISTSLFHSPPLSQEPASRERVRAARGRCPCRRRGRRGSWARRRRSGPARRAGCGGRAPRPPPGPAPPGRRRASHSNRSPSTSLTPRPGEEHDHLAALPAVAARPAPGRQLLDVETHGLQGPVGQVGVEIPPEPALGRVLPGLGVAVDTTRAAHSARRARSALRPGAQEAACGS